MFISFFCFNTYGFKSKQRVSKNNHSLCSQDSPSLFQSKILKQILSSNFSFKFWILPVKIVGVIMLIWAWWLNCWYVGEAEKERRTRFLVSPPWFLAGTLLCARRLITILISNTHECSHGSRWMYNAKSRNWNSLFPPPLCRTLWTFSYIKSVVLVCMLLWK